jgi:hypothetical protein
VDGEEAAAKAHRVAAIASRLSSLAEIVSVYTKDHHAPSTFAPTPERKSAASHIWGDWLSRVDRYFRYVVTT